MTTERRKGNRIDELKSDEGVLCSEEGGIVDEFAKYFKNLFTITQPQECDEIFEGIPRTITESVNRNLTRSIEDHEIKKALF